MIATHASKVMRLDPTRTTMLRRQYEADMRRRFAELRRVVVEAASKHHRHGNPYHIHVDLVVPGSMIVVDRDSGNPRAHEDPYTAVRDAFEAARRRLREHMRRHDGRSKPHEAPLVE